MGYFMQGVNSKIAEAMDLRSLESKVRANNIANANTPGYKAKEVDFARILRQEKDKHIVLKKTDPRHMDGVSSLPEDINEAVRETNRPVEIDEEIVKMTEANMAYQTMTHLLANRFQLFSSIIRGRVD